MVCIARTWRCTLCCNLEHKRLGRRRLRLDAHVVRQCTNCSIFTRCKFHCTCPQAVCITKLHHHRTLFVFPLKAECANFALWTLPSPDQSEAPRETRACRHDMLRTFRCALRNAQTCIDNLRMVHRVCEVHCGISSTSS